MRARERYTRDRITPKGLAAVPWGKKMDAPETTWLEWLLRRRWTVFLAGLVGSEVFTALAILPQPGLSPVSGTEIFEAWTWFIAGPLSQYTFYHSPLEASDLVILAVWSLALFAHPLRPNFITAAITAIGFFFWYCSAILIASAGC